MNVLGSAEVEIKANLAPLEAGLRKAKVETTAMVAAVNKASTGVSTGVTQMGRAFQQAGQQAAQATQLTTGQVANLGFQINDIATMLAMGSSPFQVMASQAGQVTQILGPMGLRGAVGAIGSAFMSVLNPVTLTLLGIGAAATAATAFFSESETEAEKASAAMKRHNDVVDRVANAYGDAASEVELFADRSTRILQIDATRNLREQLATLVDQSNTALDQIAPRIAEAQADGSTEYVRRLRDEYAAATPIVYQFIQSVENGRPEVEALTMALAELAVTSPDVAAGIRAALGPLDEYARRALEAKNATLQLANSMAAIQRGILQGQAYEALNARYQLDAAGAAPVIVDPNAPIPSMDPRRDLGNDARTGVAIRAARTGGGGAKKADPFEEFLSSAREQTMAVEYQTQAFRDLGLAMDEARKYAEGMVAARKDGTAATPEEEAAIRKVAEAYSAAAAEAKRLQEAQRNAEQTADFFGNTLFNALDGIVVKGRNAGEVLRNLVQQLASAGLQAALLGKGPLAGLSVGGGKQGGGIFGALFGGIKSLFGGFFAEGGNLSPGKFGIVGENGPELITGGATGMTVAKLIPAGGGAGAGGGASMVHMSMSINLEGANGDETIARIARQEAERGATTAYARAMRDAKAQSPSWVSDANKRYG